MKTLLSIFTTYIILGVIFWMLFSIAQANFNIFEWSYDSRAGLSIVLAFLLVFVGVVVPAIYEYFED